MGERSAPNLKRFLPHVIGATAIVILLPIALVSLLASVSVLGSVFVSGPIAMVVSLAASSAASAWWRKRPGSHDLVFSDLMLWGWLRRLRTERRLSRAVELLGTDSEVPREQQIAYFEELASALEARDPYTHGHTRRVTGHAVAIAERMGLPREQVAKVRTAAAIHDIGKLNTPREVLNKPGRLTDEEFDVIKRHPVDGAEMAARLGDDEITAMVRHHHERLDGTGYPDRLSGEQIPLGARIIAVADTFDAITSKRPYRGASSHNKGIVILTKEAGTQLDPHAVRAFSSHYSGRRGVAAGSLLTSLPGRLIPWRLGFGSAASLTKGIAALAVAGVLGGSAAELAKPSAARGMRRVALATRSETASPRSDGSRRAHFPRLRGVAPASKRAAHRGGPTARHAGRKPASRPSGATNRRQAPAAGVGRSAVAAAGPSASGGSSGAGPSSSPSGTPSLPTGTPSLPTGTPSLPTGTPSVPTGTPSLPGGTPSVPSGTPSLPTGTPSVPTGTPSVPTGTPPVPSGTTTVPTGTPTVPSGTPSLP
jgi:putative nucleotidyltransferase with HDIG domain